MATDIRKEPPPMVVQLNYNQLFDLVELAARTAVQKVIQPPVQPQRYAGSAREFCHIVGISEATFWRYKKNGKLDGALHQYGHSVMVDIEKAIECITGNMKMQPKTKAKLREAEKLSTATFSSTK